MVLFSVCYFIDIRNHYHGNTQLFMNLKSKNDKASNGLNNEIDTIKLLVNLYVTVSIPFAGNDMSRSKMI